MPARFGPSLVCLVLLAVLVGACDDESSASSVDDAEGTPASDAAIATDEELRLVPDGHADCGSVNLASGWPTTTVFNAEVQGECIIEAAASGEPAQMAFSGRDNDGGVVGLIVRVGGTDDITVIEYHIDPEGVVASSETTCAVLDTSSMGPPTCIEP